MKCSEIISILEALSPRKYACDWDNPGLNVGHYDKDISKVLVTLDCDDGAIDKAIEIGADLIVSHHPLIFGKLKKVNDDSLAGRRVLKLIENGIACYCMHTNFDIKGGMAALAAEYIGMKNPKILEPTTECEGLGRWDEFEKATVGEWCNRVKNAFELDNVKVFGKLDSEVNRIAIAPGSGKESVELAVDMGLNLIITGDVGHHTGIDAVAQGCNVIDAGHYGVEKIFIDFICRFLGEETKDIEVVKYEQPAPFAVV